jgi:hypothetical protein
MNPPLKLKIDLQSLPHKVIRKVLVPEDITMHQLHFVIQDVMGWFNAHLFEFCDAKWNNTIRVGIPDDFDDDYNTFNTSLRDANDVLLKNTFLEENYAKPFWYWYDFGDDWWHRISFLKVSKKELNIFAGTPVCIEAKGKCPPEDIGGPWGYADFLEIIKDKDHPEYEEVREWHDLEPSEEYDPTETNLEMINSMLGQL